MSDEDDLTMGVSWPSDTIAFLDRVALLYEQTNTASGAARLTDQDRAYWAQTLQAWRVYYKDARERCGFFNNGQINRDTLKYKKTALAWRDKIAAAGAPVAPVNPQTSDLSLGTLSGGVVLGLAAALALALRR